jgi:hypothetical protein
MGARRLRVAAAAAAFAGLAVSAERGPDTGPARPPHSAATRVKSQAISVGPTVLLGKQTRSDHCKLGPDPDRACSPGAYSKGLTKRAICSDTFRTSSIRNVTEATKNAVKVAYGLEPIAFGSALEIDHIVSLELGGSNDPANLFPERADAHPGYRVKDKLENRLHDLVCAGEITLRDARRRISSNWQKLYQKVFGVTPG